MWLGDFAYFDDPLINCDVVPDHPECNCTADFIRRPPFQCFAGVVEHARLRVQLQVTTRCNRGNLDSMQICKAAQTLDCFGCCRTVTHTCSWWRLATLSCLVVLPCSPSQLGIQEYKQFLAFMCPGYQNSGVFPPLGTDPSMCPRPIFGTYDDHDSGWNNGNAR